MQFSQLLQIWALASMGVTAAPMPSVPAAQAPNNVDVIGGLGAARHGRSTIEARGLTAEEKKYGPLVQCETCTEAFNGLTMAKAHAKERGHILNSKHVKIYKDQQLKGLQHASEEEHGGLVDNAATSSGRRLQRLPNIHRKHSNA
ncbi:uncharacterized protein PpBr36_09610 [Pyricularia pennisetigena]|uniref:uncharacterized protein n=1 Tax=Pyricularia pennisetigena TaxID=1578925 RepID=UPI00114E8BCD|nr:uncharacterized protein PpBr36_09610 [Pyricularia pennisetigena]TLS21922.1 hypothetical protein PpBr36_09610 [Pyricularia pennisetigena]